MNAVEGLQAEGVYDQREIELFWQSDCLESKGWNSYLGQVVVPLVCGLGGRDLPKGVVRR